LTKPHSLIKFIRATRPDFIVNAAAYTGVDAAEQEVGMANLVNGEAPGALAEEAKKIGAWLLHYSTDYVFDGKSDKPYTETDCPNPLNAYGASKLMGERAIQAVDGAHVILRVSWVYDMRGHNFFTKILSKARTESTLRIVDDQVGSPTPATLVAATTRRLLEFLSDKPNGATYSGVFHLAPTGETSWYLFARKILKMIGETVDTEPISSSSLNSAAQRPRYSVLSSKLLGDTFSITPSTWENYLVSLLKTPPIF
jgi:dTDP-4-dehydrorhamnose reductase